MNDLITHPDFAAPVTYDMVVMPEGADDQVAAMISMMRSYSNSDSRSQHIVQLVNDCLQNSQTPERYVCEVFNQAKSRMYFQRDELTGGVINPDALEVLVRPVDVMLLSDPVSGVKVPADCDCQSMYVASMLTAAGIPCAFATISASDKDPHAFSHVYVVAWPDDERRVAIDASHGPQVGWEAPNKGRYKEWPVGGGAVEVGSGNALCTLAFLLIVGGVWWLSSRDSRGWEN